MTLPADAPAGVETLLCAAGRRADGIQLTPLSGGMNNRVFRLETNNGPLVLKQFFPAPAGTRDRFRAEKSFYDFLQSAPTPLAAPSALAWSDEDRLGLFSWVEGRKMTPPEIDRSTVEQALNFYLELNRNRELPSAQHLLEGAEACFTFQAHLDCVERRLLRVERLPVTSDLDRTTLAFIQDSLLPAFMERRAALGLTDSRLQEELQPSARVVSPSDFGFHNALATPKNDLVFLDFEYAGWDDPAKFLCDFLCQPAVPVPADLWPFCFEVLAPGQPGGVEPGRVRQLLPFYQLKWCCILLNEFLPADDERRRFASAKDSADAPSKKEIQLAKARAAFAQMRSVDSSN